MLHKRLKVGWVCSYTPDEIIHAAGFNPVRLLPVDQPSAFSDSLLPPNICPFARQIAGNLEAGLYGKLEGVVIANSCNAMMHLFNVLSKKAQGKNNMFIYLLDLPRQNTSIAVDYYVWQLEKLTEYLGSHGEEVTVNRLLKAINLYARTIALLDKLSTSNRNLLPSDNPLEFYDLVVATTTNSREEVNLNLEKRLKESTSSELKGASVNDPCLVLTGAIPPRDLIEIIASKSPFPLLQENCMTTRYFKRLQPQMFESCQSIREILSLLSRDYLEKLSCPRMMNDNRKKYYRLLIEQLNVKGIIFYDFGFCDLHHYDSLILSAFASKKEIPFLKITSEPGQINSGQLETRLEAFIEMIV